MPPLHCFCCHCRCCYCPCCWSSATHQVAANMYMLRYVAGCVTTGAAVSSRVPVSIMVATAREPQRRPMTSPCRGGGGAQAMCVCVFGGGESGRVWVWVGKGAGGGGRPQGSKQGGAVQKRACSNFQIHKLAHQDSKHQHALWDGASQTGKRGATHTAKGLYLSRVQLCGPSAAACTCYTCLCPCKRCCCCCWSCCCWG